MLARYNVLRELGRGATGAVYAARDRQTGAVVALKRLDPARVTKADPEFAKRWVKHARAARVLKHACIATIHDTAEAAGTAYVVMEMLEGETLRKILDGGPLPVARAIRIARDIADGLAHAHLAGVLHGALTPSNIMVLPSSAAKIMDFGIGTPRPGYMSPEQLRGEPIDHRSDVFSLGAMLYEMLTRRRIGNILQAAPPPPSEVNPGIPHALDAIVLAMLAPEPAARTPGAPIVLRDLQQLMEPDRPQPTAAPQATEEQAFDYQQAIQIMDRESLSQRTAPRPSRFPAAAVALAVLAVGLGGFMHYSPGFGDRISAAQPAPAAPRAIEPRPVADATPQMRPVANKPVEQASPTKSDVTEKPVAAEPAPAPETVRVTPTPPKPVAVVAETTPQPEARRPTRTTPQSTVAAARSIDRAPEAMRATQAKAKSPKPQPNATARLIVAVSPKGDIFVDGKHHGTARPMTTLDLEPGMHRIEVRNGSRRPYLTYVTVQAGEVRHIRHDFNAKAIRPPT
jgi:eukaryotic-like serine/threonine-protein kinase